MPIFEIFRVDATGSNAPFMQSAPRFVARGQFTKMIDGSECFMFTNGTSIKVSFKDEVVRALALRSRDSRLEVVAAGRISTPVATA